MSELSVDIDQLHAFERRLDPARPEDNGFEVLGYGKLSTIFALEALPGLALKRLPPFPDEAARKHYERAVNAYHRILQDPIGLRLPPQQCLSLTTDAGQHLLYVVQPRLDGAAFAHRVLPALDDVGAQRLLEAVLHAVLRVWHRNEIEKELEVPDSLIGLDARLSNWRVEMEDGHVAALVYLDTGTPFIRRMGQDRLDPTLYLQGATPSPRGASRQRFRTDVLDRYYDMRRVLIDLLAEFVELDQAGRLPLALETVNAFLAESAEDLFIDPIGRDEVDAFARREARYWRRFRRRCRRRRFLNRNVLRRPYPFLLPER